MEKILVVDGMKCGHCKASVESALNELAGVDFAEVNLDTKEVVVKGSSLDDKILEETIDNIGFDLVEIK